MQSKAATVDEYLAQLPADRRAAIQQVCQVIRENLDGGYEEGMQYGMIGYYVPHRVFPQGYHCDPRQPLPFAGLASQKGHMSLYLMSLYSQGQFWEWFGRAWAETGKKLDMGRCCIRFKRVEDLALDVIAEALRRMPAREYVRLYQQTLDTRHSATAGSRSAGKAATKHDGSGAKRSPFKSAAPNPVTTQKRRPTPSTSGTRKANRPATTRGPARRGAVKKASARRS